MVTEGQLARSSYAFAMLSRIYWLCATLAGVYCVVASSAAAYLSTQKNDEQAVLGLTTSVAVLSFLGRLYDPSENSAVCRSIARELDKLRSDLAHARLSEDQVSRRIAKLQRRVPVGSCVFLRS